MIPNINQQNTPELAANSCSGCLLKGLLLSSVITFTFTGLMVAYAMKRDKTPPFDESKANEAKEKASEPDVAMQSDSQPKERKTLKERRNERRQNKQNAKIGKEIDKYLASENAEGDQDFGDLEEWNNPLSARRAASFDNTIITCGDQQIR